jgi:hypothetical protein
MCHLKRGGRNWRDSLERKLVILSGSTPTLGGGLRDYFVGSSTWRSLLSDRIGCIECEPVPFIILLLEYTLRR